MDDGWDDDLDLDVTLDSDPAPSTAQPSSTYLAPSPFAPIVPSPTEHMDNEEVVEDGWDDDTGDNLNFDEFDDGDGAAPRKEDNIGGKDNDDDTGGGFPMAAPVSASPPAGGDGWEEDDDDLNFDDDGWGDNTDEILNEEQGPVASIQPVPEHAAPPNQRIISELQDYVSSLNRMLSSINAVLEFEYNTLEKAYELVEYYSSRPQLAQYTITKELQRMSYQVILPHGHVETDKDQIIAKNLLPGQSLVSRAANQSLLADLLHVITGHDLIVRPQYLAICVASWCQFTIHLGDEGQDLVQCQAKLNLSFPTEQGDRLDVAAVHVAVVFAPGQPMVEYKVRKIELLLQDFSLLSGTAEFLAAMEGHLDEVPGHLESERMQHAPADIFRDQFLENSQRLFSQSKLGMKSALQQVDSVINVRGKIKAISSFIPATDTMLAAEQEAMDLAEARRQEMERRWQDEPLHHRPPTNEAQALSHLFPRPPPPPPPTQQPPQNSQEAANRPKSILGSLFGTIANSVNIPEDDDPVIYGAAPSIQAAPEPPHFYRKEEPTPGQQPFGTLNPNPAVPQVEAPVLYRKEEPTQPAAVPQPYRKEEQSALTTAPKPPPPPPPKPMQAPPIVMNKQARPSIHHGSTPGHAFVPTHPRSEVSNDPEAVQEHHVAEDGWDENAVFDELNNEFGDDLDDTEGAGNAAKVKATAGVEDGWDSVEMSEASTVQKDADDDTIPTRKRWLNPRPNRPYLHGLI
jgi:hypothetical protein